MGQTSHQRELISAIRFGYYGSKKLARQGRTDIARHFRAVARRGARELRALRAGGAA